MFPFPSFLSLKRVVVLHVKRGTEVPRLPLGNLEVFLSEELSLLGYPC